MTTAAIRGPTDTPRPDAEALRAQKKREIRISKKSRDDVGVRLIFEAVSGIAASAGVIAWRAWDRARGHEPGDPA